MASHYTRGYTVNAPRFFAAGPIDPPMAHLSRESSVWCLKQHYGHIHLTLKTMSNLKFLRANNRLVYINMAGKYVIMPKNTCNQPWVLYYSWSIDDIQCRVSIKATLDLHLLFVLL